MHKPPRLGKDNFEWVEIFTSTVSYRSYIRKFNPISGSVNYVGMKCSEMNTGYSKNGLRFITTGNT